MWLTGEETGLNNPRKPVRTTGLMFKPYYIIKPLILFFMVLTAAGCAQQQLQTHTTPNNIILKPEDFSKEIARLGAITKRGEQPDHIKVHLQLAKLYSHHKNPNPDYLLALKELESYISHDTEGGKADEIQNWLAVLRRLKMIIDEKNQIAQEHQDTNAKMEQIIKENQDMKKTVEQLESLDIRIEEKRKQLK